jgi:hypothetical protein
MTPVLLAALLAVGADEAKAPPTAEGKWLIVYAEENSRRNNSWENRQATVKGNTLSYAEEGKELKLELTFGDKQTLKATTSDKDKKTSYGGVCIASQDYLCISLNPEGAKDEKKDGDKPASSGAFILILRRQK